MNSRANLSNSNLIKKLLIGLTLCLMMITGVLTSTPETVKAAVIKNKTFYIYSDYEVDITFCGNNDDTGETKYNGYWPSSLGTITLSGYGTYNGRKGYKVEMKNVNVTDYTPYCRIKAYPGSGYYPASISIVGDDKQTGANHKANAVHNLDDISNEPDYRFFYIGYEYTVTELQINYEYLNYTLSYNLNGGTSNSAFNSQTKKHDVNLTIHSAIPTKLGNKFICWKDSGGTTYGGTGGKMTYSKNQNDVLTAQWEASKYEIVFNPNKPSSASHQVEGSMNKIPAKFGQSFNLPENKYSLVGWEFTGWNTKPDGSGIGYPNCASAKNLSTINGGTTTLYAQWKPLVFTMVLNEMAPMTSGTTTLYEKYDVGWYDNAGCTNKRTSITLPTKIGYTFEGYYTEEDGGGDCVINGSGAIMKLATICCHLLAPGEGMLE